MPRPKKNVDTAVKPEKPKKPRAAKTVGDTLIESISHTDAKRPNIPTRENTPFVRDDEKTTKCVLYPRDPSLDPQLVWKGKDEQDAVPLNVPAVPI